MSRHSSEWNQLPLHVRLAEEERRLEAIRARKKSNSNQKNQDLLKYIQGD